MLASTTTRPTARLFSREVMPAALEHAASHRDVLIVVSHFVGIRRLMDLVDEVLIPSARSQLTIHRANGRERIVVDDRRGPAGTIRFAVAGHTADVSRGPRPAVLMVPYDRATDHDLWPLVDHATHLYEIDL